MAIPNPWDHWRGHRPPMPVPLMSLPPRNPITFMDAPTPFLYIRPPAPVPPPQFPVPVNDANDCIVMDSDSSRMNDNGEPPELEPQVEDYSPSPGICNLPPPYAGITGRTFGRQVPPNVLPLLRFPPPNPPMFGQPIFNPYIITPFTPEFGILFERMLLENFNPESKDNRKLITDFKCLSLVDQLTQFMFSRTLSVEQVRIRWQLVMDILFVLRQNFPESEVHAFGSVLSGLGDLSSDIDIFVDLLGPTAPRPMTPNEALNRLKRLFRKLQCPHTNRPFYDGPLISIPHARVPLLRMIHKESKISFDLTFENRLSAQNSRLVVLYTNMDPRVFRFMVLIRYWLKFHNLAGPNDIKNYALTLLCLVYLVRKGIVPSVHFLQNLKAAERKEQGLEKNPDEIEGWDASFCDNIDQIRKHFPISPIPPDFSENPTKHLLQMAVEFFKECAITNFGACVVCPLLGEELLKGTFLPGNEEFLPPQFELYKNLLKKKPNARLKIKTPLCVQDPFVLNFNVTSGAPLGSVCKFQIACAKTVEVLKAKLENGGKEASLLDLFTPLPTHLKNKDINKFYRHDMKKRRLKRQIFGALGMIEEVKRLVEEDEAVEHKNDYCRLPSHMVAMNKMITKEDFQRWQKEQDLNELMQVSMTNQFSLEFFEEINISGVLRPFEAVDGWHIERLKLVRKLAKMWRDFAIDFLVVFFKDVLKVTCMTDKSVEMIGPAEPVGIEDLYGLGAKSAWKVLEKKGVIPRNDTKKNSEFEMKLKDLEEFKVDEMSYCKIMTIKINYPFWKNRPFKLNEWKEGEMKVLLRNGAVEYVRDPIEVEGLISDWSLINHQKRHAEGKKGDKENSGEEQQEKKRLKSDTDQFTPFTVDVLVNISAPVGEAVDGLMSAKDVMDSLERPMLTMIFQSKKTGQSYRDALTKISALFQGCFPEYQTRRLKEWIGKS